MSAGYMFYQLKKGSHRVRGSQAAKKVKSVFCSGVYVAKTTPAQGTERSETPLLKKGYALFEQVIF